MAPTHHSWRTRIGIFHRSSHLSAQWRLQGPSQDARLPRRDHDHAKSRQENRRTTRLSRSLQRPRNRCGLDTQGARLLGKVDSVVVFGQSRALVVWQRSVMPNGTSIEIDNLPATNTEGYAGLKDEVDYHTWRLLKGIGLSTLLGVGTQLSPSRFRNRIYSAFSFGLLSS